MLGSKKQTSHVHCVTASYGAHASFGAGNKQNAAQGTRQSSWKGFNYQGCHTMWDSFRPSIIHDSVPSITFQSCIHNNQESILGKSRQSLFCPVRDFTYLRLAPCTCLQRHQSPGTSNGCRLRGGR